MCKAFSAYYNVFFAARNPFAKLFHIMKDTAQRPAPDVFSCFTAAPSG